MAVRREEAVRRRLEDLLDEVAGQGPGPQFPGDRIPREAVLACIEAGFESRLLDLAARQLKNRGAAYYTVGSAGHEANAMLGHRLRPTDRCLLHYRSGAFMAARTQDAPARTFADDILLSFVASAEDPVAGGRHKVWGSRSFEVPPQTSTIASHLPKAVGTAFALERAARLGLDTGLPRDAIVMASFGDASVNHASATTAFNAACWAAHQHIPLPILFVCEDNGVGISVHTPPGWIRSALGGRSELTFLEVDGRDLVGLYETVGRAIDGCRRTRRPCFLRIAVVRLLGHAGSDVETTYHDRGRIEADEGRDPLLAWVRFACDRGFVTGRKLRARYEELRGIIEDAAQRAVGRRKLTSAREVAADLDLPSWESIRAEAGRAPTPDARLALWGGPSKLPEADRPRHMAMLLARALADLMLVHPEMLVFGEDVARKGGVYHVTAGLAEHFGAGRVFNTLLDETIILGLAIGAAQVGMLPVPEIQYLAYLHNAEDQIRGEACSQRFFSRGQWDNPMVVRVASFAYQEGFGGHFHNDDSIAVLRDVPGLILAAPSRGDDAVRMLRTCVAAASAGRRVSVFLEPIALYMRKDLHSKGDGAWSFPYPPPGEAAPLGEPRDYEAEETTGARILVATYANGVPIALRARRRAAAHASVRILDLRWLAPLPVAAFLGRAAECDAVLVVDECRRSGGGVAEALLAALAEDPRTRGTLVRRITAEDSYVPLGPAADLVLPDEDSVARAIEDLAAEVDHA